MIHSYTFENFYSFKDETSISFNVSKSAPFNEHFFTAPCGQRLSKALAVIGPNAGGKTDLLKSLVFLSWFMIHSFKALEEDQKISFEPFIFTQKKGKPTHFEIEFGVNGTRYLYRLTLTKDKILNETLKFRPGKSWKIMFGRNITEQKDKLDSDILIKNLDVKQKTIRPLVRKNASLFSILYQSGIPKILEISTLFRNMKTNVGPMGRVPEDEFENILNAADLFKKQEDPCKFGDKLLAQFDLGISKTEIYKGKRLIKEKEVEIPFPFGIHEIGNEKYSLPLIAESSGTKNLYIILSKLLPILKNGGLFVMDEFEVDLHPLMIPKLLDLFFDKTTNPHDAQILFSTHSVDVLNELEKEQILLVEKDEQCRSEAWRLDEIKGVRRDENYYAKYMSGAYGAVPDI